MKRDNSIPIVKEYIDKAFDIAKHLSQYFRIEWAVLLYPKKTFKKFFSGKDSLLLFKAISFFLINIIIVYILGLFVKYNVGEFPLKTRSIFDIFLPANILLLVGPYALGTLAFAIMLKLIGKGHKIAYSLSKTFSVICYASAIYAPFVLGKTLSNNLLSGILKNKMMLIFNQTAMSFGTADNIKIVFWLVLKLFFISWWLWLIYIGLNALGVLEKKRLKKIVIFAFLIFYIFKFSIDCIVIHKENLKALKIFIAQVIEKALSAEPPNYIKASQLARDLADCKLFSPYLQYTSKVRRIAYILAFFSPILDDKGKEVVNQSLGNISGQNYDEAQHILNSYVRESLSDKRDADLWRKEKRGGYLIGYGMTSPSEFCETLIADLREAEQLRNLHDYKDKDETIEFRFFNLFPKFSYSWIVLFP